MCIGIIRLLIIFCVGVSFVSCEKKHVGIKSVLVWSDPKNSHLGAIGFTEISGNLEIVVVLSQRKGEVQPKFEDLSQIAVKTNDGNVMIIKPDFQLNQVYDSVYSAIPEKITWMEFQAFVRSEMAGEPSLETIMNFVKDIRSGKK